MGFRGLIVEDLQNGRELERSTRFATRNRKKPRQHWTSAPCGVGRDRIKLIVHEQSIESI
jgi:hypothetical protein